MKDKSGNVDLSFQRLSSRAMLSPDKLLLSSEADRYLLAVAVAPTEGLVNCGMGAEGRV